MTATLAPIRTAAQLVAAALGLPTDDRIHIEITRNPAWDHALCEDTGRPACVNVAWLTLDSDGEWTTTDCALAADVAGPAITYIAASDRTDPCETITVEVSHQWVRYTHPDIAPSL